MSTDKHVVILDEEIVFSKAIFHLREAQLKYRRYDGSMSEPIKRLSLDRGDSVAVLMHNQRSNQIILTEQFKYPTYDANDRRRDGWILEIPAGTVEAGEDPEATARREMLEETGYALETMQHISTFYVSPGGTSERIILYYAPVTDEAKQAAGGGLAGEGEDIRTVFMDVDHAMRAIENGQLNDAKTIIALQWLALQREK